MGDGFHSLLFSTSEIFNAKVLNKCKSLGKYIWVRTLSITLTIITQKRLSSLHASRPAGAGKKSAPLRLSNKLPGGRHSSFYSVRPCELQVRPVSCSGNSFVSLCYFYCTAAVVLGDGGGHCFVGDVFYLKPPRSSVTSACFKANQLWCHYRDFDLQRQKTSYWGAQTPAIKHRCMGKAVEAWGSQDGSLVPGEAVLAETLRKVLWMTLGLLLHHNVCPSYGSWHLLK